MKKLAVSLMVVFLFFGMVISADAFVYSGTFPDGNEWDSWDRFSWDGVNNVQLYYNNNNATVGIAVLDPNGTPLVYWWADFYTTYVDLYYSYDGINWAFYDRYLL